MTPNNPEKDELEKAVRETLNDHISPDLEERMRGSLREFRGKLKDHPYVRSLEKKRRLEGGNTILRVARWKLILVCLAIGYVLLINRTEAVRHDRISAVVEGRAPEQTAPSLIAEKNIRELNRELDRLLAQVPTKDSKGTETP